MCDGKRWGRWGQFKAEGPRQWALERGGVMNEGELRPTTPELRLQDMDRDGVDATVMYGPTDPFYTEDPELRYELYRGYNDWLESFTSACPERLIGASQIPLDDPQAAAQEMERVAKLGSRHVNIMASRAEPPIWHESWDRFWSIAEESGIPVGSHIAVLTFNQPQTDKPVYSNNAVDRAVGGFRVNSQLVEPVCGLIFGGVLDRHPKLKFVMGESDLAWIPYIWSRTPNDPLISGRTEIANPRVFSAPDLDDVHPGLRRRRNGQGRHLRAGQGDVVVRLSASGQLVAELAANHREGHGRRGPRPEEEAAVPERGRPVRALKEMPHLSRRAFVRGVGATLLLGPGLLSACGVTTAPPAATNPPASAAAAPAATSAPAAATVPPAATTAPAPAADRGAHARHSASWRHGARRDAHLPAHHHRPARPARRRPGRGRLFRLPQAAHENCHRHADQRAAAKST